MAKLDFLVPQYKEDKTIAANLLDSIAMQRGIDFKDIRVIICNDGTDVNLPADWLASFPFQIDYYHEEHGGVSATRNKALDHSDGELVMFCDIDDGFYSALGVWSIFKIYEKAPFDVLVPVFVEEQYDTETGVYNYLDHDKGDQVFVHGKVFRRQYLIEKELRFDPSLTIHEDSFFINLAQKCTTNVFRSDASFYVWKYRPDSICRADPLYLLKTYVNLRDTQTALLEEYRRREFDEQWIGELVVNFSYMTYYMMWQHEWMKPANKKWREKAEKEFREYIRKYVDLGKNVPLNRQMEISQMQRAASIPRGMIQEAMSFGTWMRKML